MTEGNFSKVTKRRRNVEIFLILDYQLHLSVPPPPPPYQRHHHHHHRNHHHQVREEKQHGIGMVSRRAIISRFDHYDDSHDDDGDGDKNYDDCDLIRSRDDLQQQLGGCLPSKQFTGEDQWFSKEKLYKVRVMVL